MFCFLRRLWQGETDGLTAAAFIVGAASILADLAGVLRDRALASTFGAGNQLDVYYAAFRIPDFLYNLVVLGALSAGFIPVFTHYLKKRGDAEAFALAERILSVVGVSVAVACAFAALATPWIMPIMTPGFSPEKMEMTIRLTRILFLSPVFLGLSAVMGGVLQSTRRFLAFSLAPVLYNCGIIFGVLVLAKPFGIAGVAWGVVIGAALHFLTQASVAVPLGMRRLRAPSFKDEGVRRILKLMIPRAAGLAVTQFNLVILLALASSLQSGSVAVFNLANNLQSFPLGLIGISFAIAAFPELARAAASDDKRAYAESLGSAGRKILFLILPTTIIFLLLRAQIVRLILGDGRFNWDDTKRTADVLGWLALSLPAQTLIPLIARAFYAVQDTWTPIIIGFVCEIVNIGFALALRPWLGITGLAVAFSAAAFLQLVLLWIWLRLKRGPLGQGEFTVSAAKTLVASIALGLVAYPVRVWIGTVYPLRTFWQVALQGVAAGLCGSAAFLIVVWLLRSRELNEFVQAISRRLWRKASVTGGVDEATKL